MLVLRAFGILRCPVTPHIMDVENFDFPQKDFL